MQPRGHNLASLDCLSLVSMAGVLQKLRSRTYDLSLFRAYMLISGGGEFCKWPGIDVYFKTPDYDQEVLRAGFAGNPHHASDILCLEQRKKLASKPDCHERLSLNSS